MGSASVLFVELSCLRTCLVMQCIDPIMPKSDNAENVNIGATLQFLWSAWTSMACIIAFRVMTPLHIKISPL